METRQQRKERFEADKASQKKAREEMIKLVRKVRSDIGESGLRSVELKYEYYRSMSSADPKKLEAYRLGIEQYKDYLKRNK